MSTFAYRESTGGDATECQCCRRVLSNLLTVGGKRQKRTKKETRASGASQDSGVSQPAACKTAAFHNGESTGSHATLLAALDRPIRT